MAKKILISAVITPDGVLYNQLVETAADGSIFFHPVDAELSETRYINGILLFCNPGDIQSILVTIQNYTGSGIVGICEAIIRNHPHVMDVKVCANNAFIYDLKDGKGHLSEACLS